MWRFKGAWPTIASPTLIWLLIVAGQQWRLKGVVMGAVAFIIFFGSIAYLIRTQFALRGNT